MTNEACRTTCQRLGYPFAGTEYHNECFCSHTFNGDNGIEKTSDCNTPCTGDNKEMCGGPSRITAWGFGDARGPAPIPEDPTTAVTPTTTSASTTTPASTAKMGWKYLGCMTDLVDGVRTFGEDVSGLVPGTNDNMTNAGCQAACQLRNLRYCGVEWSRECFGSNTINGNNELAADSGCNMDCAGKAGEKCGGSARLSAWEYGAIENGDTTTLTAASTTTASASVVTPSPSPSSRPREWKSLGCLYDNRGGRVFTNPQSNEVAGGPRNMTNAGCNAACQSLGFRYAGTQVGSLLYPACKEADRDVFC
jgi:hypothetical protein